MTHSIPEDAVVIAKLDPSTAVEHNLTLSPNIVLVDSGGVVRHMWLGGDAERERGALERAVGLM